MTSGKGGVGKSNFSLTFALGLIEAGKKVVILDVGLGLANIDVLVGLSPQSYLFEMIEKGKTVWEVLEKGDLVHNYLEGTNKSVYLPQGVKGFLKRMMNHIK